MTEVSAVMVRVYLSESDRELKRVIQCLHDEIKVCGVTVTRGIEGYGHSGQIHTASLLELSLDLPLILEFYDRPEKVALAIERIKDIVKPGHVVSWPVNVQVGENVC